MQPLALDFPASKALKTNLYYLLIIKSLVLYPRNGRLCRVALQKDFTCIGLHSGQSYSVIKMTNVASSPPPFLLPALTLPNLSRLPWDPSCRSVHGGGHEVHLSLITGRKGVRKPPQLSAPLLTKRCRVTAPTESVAVFRTCFLRATNLGCFPLSLLPLSP